MSDQKNTANQKRSRLRAGIVIAVVFSALIGAGVFLALAAVAKPDDKALDIVEEIELRLDRGDFEGAHTYVDYRSRLAEELGELWEEGDAAAKDGLERLTRDMLIATTEKVWPSCCHGRQMQRTIVSSSEDTIWVESRPIGPDAPDFIWRYRLNRRQDAWRITQRDYVKDRVPNDTARYWPMARKAVAIKLGREPTLAEFQANLLSVGSMLRVRTFQVPDLPAKTPSPKKSDAPTPEVVAP